jgi:hypothetical protein
MNCTGRVNLPPAAREVTWLQAQTLKGLRPAVVWRRGEVRLHFDVLERFREEHGE